MTTIKKKSLISIIKELYANANKDILEKIIEIEKPDKEIDINHQYDLSTKTLGNYTTLDEKHRQDIRDLRKNILNYANDNANKRPLNIIMQAEPGSGKSHFIKCLANKLKYDDVDAVTFNMSSIQNLEDFVQPLEAVRNLKVVDQLPILFLDEFDSDQKNYSLLLPLLWDGELHVRQINLKLGKIVIILAGSGSEIENAMKASKSMSKEINGERTKLVDLLSRINGGEFEIPGLDEKNEERDRRVDKICIALTLLTRRFGYNLTKVPWSLLKFIALNKFRYGVRSLTHFIDLIPAVDDEIQELTIKDLKLPLTNTNILKGSSLSYHLIAEDGPTSITNLWKELTSNASLVKFRSIEEDELPF